MSDSRNEAEGLGAADPITGVVAGGDDLAADTRLADDTGDDGDWETTRADAEDLVTNDAVAGETVEPGAGDRNDGPTGGAPTEITPDESNSRLQDDGADLDSQNEDAY